MTSPVTSAALARSADERDEEAAIAARDASGTGAARAVSVANSLTAMKQLTRQVLRTVFVVVGTLFALGGIATLTLFIVLRPPGEHSDALRGGFVYLVIAAIGFFAVWRLRPPKVVARGFDVVSKPTDDPGAG